MAKNTVIKQKRFYWDAVTGATSYKFMWGTSTGVYTNSFSVTDVQQHRASGLQPNLANGTTYFLVIRAVDAEGESSDSNEISVLNGVQQ